MKRRTLFLLLSTQACAAQVATSPKAALDRMGGCFIVDYNFHETKPLAASYSRDERVYDVNEKKTVYEWVAVTHESDSHVRLQHVLFVRDMDGKLSSQSMMRHQAEDWEQAAKTRFAYVSPGVWKQVPVEPSIWLRRVTDLDDGLRYQCAAPWQLNDARAEWKCQDLAPIPGRETRDMKRKDYDTLDRMTHVVAFNPSGNWVERQDNTKIVHRDGSEEKLAQEAGRNWYMRVPESECVEARAYASKRERFWRLSRQAWTEYLAPLSEYREKNKEARGSRFAALGELEQRWVDGKVSDAEAQLALGAIIATSQEK